MHMHKLRNDPHFPYPGHNTLVWNAIKKRFAFKSMSAEFSLCHCRQLTPQLKIAKEQINTMILVLKTSHGRVRSAKL